MEENLNKLLYINEDLIKEKKEIRNKIYEKISNLKNNSNFYGKEFYIKERNLFQEFKALFDFEDEFTNLTDKYNNLCALTASINIHSDKIKKLRLDFINLN